ncbi:unnamed protein product [Chrysoparadoxa australica]
MFICYIGGCVVSTIGAVVAGVIAVLIEWISVGLCLGTLTGLAIILLDGDTLIQSGVAVNVMFALTLAVCIFVTWKAPKMSMITMTSLSGGLLIAYGLDALLERSLLLNTGVVMQLDWPASMHCYSDCHMRALIGVWLSLAACGVLVQSHISQVWTPFKKIIDSCTEQIIHSRAATSGGYEPIPSGAGRSARASGATGGTQKTFTYPDNQGYNYFPLDKMPPGLQLYSDVAFATGERLANFFGFQDDNVRNQVDHVLSLAANHRRFADAFPTAVNGKILQPPPTAIHSLHDKLFENYKLWCETMHITPRFLVFPNTGRGYNEPAEVQAKMIDIMLWMCIWGEASNLRHIPECLCFLYHKMMQEFEVHGGAAGESSLYAGFFLDHVVTPIWEVIVKSHRSRGDHIKSRNYDDFNEFFWSPACLQHSYRILDMDSSPLPSGPNHPGIRSRSVSREPHSRHAGSTPMPTPIFKGLESAPKTFLEKRSILSTILTFHRVLEFHIVTFQALAAYSFADILVWDTYYTWQMVSSTLWTFNFLGIIWTMLEVWQAFPGINITGTARFGFLVRLLTRFVILLYQTLYFMWSIDDGPGVKTGLQAEGSPIFWWWQYLWLSLFSMSLYFVEGLFQLVPSLAAWFCTRKNDYVNAFLNIAYPNSRLYVGKNVYVTMKEFAGIFFFWVTLLAWKMYFSYQYEIRILVLPTTELFDDFMNFPDGNIMRTILLMVLRWIPQGFIYLIDTSIWFACWSAMAGTFVGMQEGLGEVADFDGIRSCFMKIPQVFCSKVICPGISSTHSSVAEMVEETESPSMRSSTFKKHDSSTELMSETTKLLTGGQGHRMNSMQRYVAEFLDVRTQKWAAFAAVWNEVINQMRLTDVISNAEQDMLKFHSFGGFAKPVYLPIFQTAGSVERSLAIINASAQAYHLEEDTYKASAIEEAMFKKIRADVTVHEAISEVWELGVWLMRQLLGPVHDSDMARIEQIVNEVISGNVVMAHLNLRNMGSVVKDVMGIVSILQKTLHKRKDKAVTYESDQMQASVTAARGYSKPKANGIAADSSASSMKKSISTSGLQKMNSNGRSEAIQDGTQTTRRKNLKPRNTEATVLDQARDEVRDKLRPLFNNLKRMVVSLDDRGTEVLDRLTFVLSLEQGFMWDDAYASNRLDRLAQDDKTKSILSKLHGLLALQHNDAEPHSPEARRRLCFFVNSLFMDMPRAPPVSDMISCTTMTPYYNEPVLYSRKDLEQKNEDGLSTAMYLQALYKHDWRNFLERHKVEDEQQQVWGKKLFREMRLWASLRSQTLARTVEGMMYYEAALRLLAHLEKIRPDHVENLVKQKYQYVVACQVYGRMKKNQDPKADDIDWLLRRFPNLRIAYIDELRVTREGTSEFFSVLIKANTEGTVEEVYRVKLPGNPVVGEGKPENQNHAIIFTRGECVQAIDMNQEAYFEEALKLRCLLQEFVIPSEPRTTIVGFREHIFTGSVSSLANYMALQELSFVTLGQRVLDKPLRVRMHYGHPDIFDKLFFATRGGVSKASKGINLSEDIFAGYNNAIRGGQVVHREYTAVGKGRDTGMQQIYKFEAKLSQGAAEQTLSRDVNRLGSRLDFFRLMSFYFGGLGYYIGNFVTVTTITFVVYFMLALAVFNAEVIGHRQITPEGTLQMLLAGMGILNTLPMLATLMVEKGLQHAISTVAQVFISGGPMYFMFHIQTRAHYFYQTLLAGGAQYRATGRGFVTHHTPFDDIYRFFASSHFYLGFNLIMALVLMAFLSTAKQYFGRTWSLWLAAASFLFAPFWFNPLSYEWGKCSGDYKKWMRWMSGHGGSPSNSWEVWWHEENSYLPKLSLHQKIPCLIQPTFCLLIGTGIASPKMSSLHSGEVKALRGVYIIGTLLAAAWVILHKYGSRFSPFIRRIAKIFIIVFTISGTITFLLLNMQFIKPCIGLYYILSCFANVGVLLGQSWVRYLYRVHDFVIGHFMFLCLFFLSGLQFPAMIQTWLLFHNALSQGVVIEDILKYARHTQETASVDDTEDTASLRKLVKHQDFLLQQLMSKQEAAEAGNYSKMAGENVTSMPLAEEEEVLEESTTASMMRASKSTLLLSDMATNKPSNPGAFQFSGPSEFPPRDP